MSKIFDAYRKQVGETLDLGLEVAQAGSFKLYPTPSPQQQAEFDQLANRMLALRLESRGAVVGFASSSAGEGSSFVSYTAASILARVYNQKVVWLDMNFLNPQKKLKGLNQSTVASLLQDPEQADLLSRNESPLLIPAGDNLMGARGLFAGQQYEELLSRLSRRFDFAIVDLPPVLSSADTALMASVTDGLLLVVEQKFLKWEVIEHGVQSLRDKDVQVLGAVINRRKFEIPKIIYDRL